MAQQYSPNSDFLSASTQSSSQSAATTQASHTIAQQAQESFDVAQSFEALQELAELDFQSFAPRDTTLDVDVASIVFEPAISQIPSKGPVAELVLEEELRLLRERAETCESEAGRQEAFHKLMRLMKGSRPEVRLGVSTASRLRVWEEPLVAYVVEYASKNRTNRFIAVRALLDNIATGCGHLSVNRAKQSIKAIAKASGLERLARELQHPSANVREQAAELLGWLKIPRAIEPLVRAYAVATGRERTVLNAVLDRHYAAQVIWYVRSRVPELSHVLDDFKNPE